MYKKTIKRILLALLGLLALAMAGIGIAVYVVFTPARITPVVLSYANDYLDAQLECESVELTFFSTFPNFGIRLKNGSVIARPDSLAAACPQDTLLLFRDFVVSFNPLTLYKDNRLVVLHARLERPVIYAYVSPDGKANWNILPADSTATEAAPEAAPEAAGSGGKPFSVEIKSIAITDANVVYDNRRQALFVATDRLRLSAKGTPTDVDLRLGVNAVTTFYENKTYTSKLPLTIAAHVISDESYQQFTMEKSSFSIGIMNFDIAASVMRDTANNRVKLDADFSLHASSLAELMEAIPAHILNVKQLSASGKLDFSGTINGYIGSGQSPLCNVSLQLQDGAVVNKKFPDKPLLQKIEIDCDAQIDWSNSVPSHINMKKLYLQNAAAEIEISGAFTDIFTQPFIDAKIAGDIDFNRMWSSLPFDTTMNMGGSVAINMSGSCSLNDLVAFDYGKINATGTMDINNVFFKYPQEGIDVFAPLAKIKIGSHVTDSIRGREIASLFRANVEMDSLMFRWKNDLALNAGNLRATFRTAAPKDSVSIAEMSVFARLTNIRLQMADSVRLRAAKITAMGKLASAEGQPDKPEWTARVKLDTLRGRTPALSARIHNAALAVSLKQRETRARRSGQQTGTDSLLRLAFQDSLARANRNTTAVSFRLADGETKDLLSKWDVSGSFTGNSINLRTPYFPLRTRLTESSIVFTTDKISIVRAQLQAGASDMHLSGDIEGIRRALLRNGRMTAKLSMDVDSMDCNEIIKALAAGSEYAGKSAVQQDSISQIVLNESTDLQQTADTMPVGLLVVPRNLDVECDANMKKVKYGKFNVDAARGKIIVRNQSVQIPDLQVQSDLGNINLSMVYKAPTTKGAYTGIDIHMSRIHVGELIRSIPMLDSLTPMLHAFEGMVECTITAVTELDSLSNVIIPKTTASCYISGKNMVVLDGETFSTIAKKLYFKNKNRNMIDSIAVDLVLEDSKIMVFPFVVSLDRYVAAVGGTQNLDMSFQYHISILKWPVPLIKVGLNLWGTPDHVHYALASRKYADLSSPAKTTSLESTVINLRRQVHESLRKSIDAILNEPAATLSRSRPSVTTNAAAETIFELDTTKIALQPVPDSLQALQEE
jgi:hypothetical protein